MVIKGILFVIAALTVALGVIALAQYQSQLRAPATARRSPPAPAAEERSHPQPSPSTANGTSSESTGESVAGGTIDWQTTMASARRQAAANNGLIIVDIYTDWCGWCKRMDRDIYTAPAVVALSRNHVFLKYDAEDGGEGESFANKMRVTGYPTTLILNSDGEALRTFAGYPGSPQRFISIIEGARSAPAL